MNQHTKPNAPVLDSYWMPFTANRQFKAAPRLKAWFEACRARPAYRKMWDAREKEPA